MLKIFSSSVWKSVAMLVIDLLPRTPPSPALRDLAVTSHGLSDGLTPPKDFFVFATLTTDLIVLRHFAPKKIGGYRGLRAIAFGSPWRAARDSSFFFAHNIILIKILININRYFSRMSAWLTHPLTRFPDL
jgi:hypothetical protein